MAWQKSDGLCNLREHLFEVLLFLAEIFDLLGAVGFALDGDGAGITGFAQAFEDLAEVDEAGADEDFFAELVRIGGPAAVFRVHGVDVRAEDGDGIHGIGFAVEDEVGGVEADAEVGLGNIAEGTRHGGRRLLAGPHEETLILLGAVLRTLLDGGNSFLVDRAAGILRDEAAVRLDLMLAEEFGEIRYLPKP